MAATEHLHERLAKMGDRIRQLEDALATSHSQNSQEPHPILHDGWSAAARDVGPEDDFGLPAEETTPTNTMKPQPQQTPHVPETLNAFGTLTISDHGVARFFGPTGGSEVRYEFLDERDNH